MSPYLRITAGHFVAGVDISELDICTRAAPILAYMVGWRKEKIEEYCNRKGWEVEELKVVPPSLE